MCAEWMGVIALRLLAWSDRSSIRSMMNLMPCGLWDVRCVCVWLANQLLNS